MTSKVAVRVQGIGHTFDFTLDDTEPFSVVEKELRKYLDRVKGRFGGLTVTLNLGRRLMNQPEVEELRRILKEEYRIVVGGLWSDALPVEQALSESLSTPITIGQPPRNQRLPRPVDPNNTLLVRRTCRTGTTVQHTGTIVVLGNVNPGAEIMAGGDIIVVGTLRGLAHAGAYGNAAAIIVATRLEASQIRIASCIGINPAEGVIEKTTNGPEMASIQGEIIVIEPYGDTAIRQTRATQRVASG